jgi:hypothetical protein
MGLHNISLSVYNLVRRSSARNVNAATNTYT